MSWKVRRALVGAVVGIVIWTTVGYAIVSVTTVIVGSFGGLTFGKRVVRRQYEAVPVVRSTYWQLVAGCIGAGGGMAAVVAGIEPFLDPDIILWVLLGVYFVAATGPLKLPIARPMIREVVEEAVQGALVRKRAWCTSTGGIWR